jgi:hypothetical protein
MAAVAIAVVPRSIGTTVAVAVVAVIFLVAAAVAAVVAVAAAVAAAQGHKIPYLNPSCAAGFVVVIGGWLYPTFTQGCIASIRTVHRALGFTT